MDARQHFLRHFEPNGDGFTYRSTLDGRGVLVSPEERERMTTIYDSRRRTAIILSVLNLPLTFCVAHSIHATPALSSWTAPVAWTMLLGVTLAAFLWAYVGPGRIVRGRLYIDFGTPAFLIEERRLEALRQTSWIKLFRRWFWMALLGFSAYVHTNDENFGRVEAAGVMLFALLSFVRDAVEKYGAARKSS